MRMLLHACCGPCSLEPSRILREEGHEITIFYANPNIAPDEEYAHRLETLRSWAEPAGLAVSEGVCDRGAWQRTAGRIGEAALEEARERVAGGCDRGRSSCHLDDVTGGPSPVTSGESRGFGRFGELTLDEAAALAVDPEKRAARCRACYRLRLEEAAQRAAEGGFEALSTTLAVSPYQYTDIIREELERAAAQAGVRAVFEDFRPFYPEATRRSRELGMYRQNYCGCVISDLEASAERAERKAERRAQHDAERAAHADERAAAEAERAARKADRAAYDAKQARKRAILKALREQQNEKK
ncbi:MAG: epoxyqueuosine reductase QueH [Eggerthellaceae bacterium]